MRHAIANEPEGKYLTLRELKHFIMKAEHAGASLELVPEVRVSWRGKPLGIAVAYEDTSDYSE